MTIQDLLALINTPADLIKQIEATKPKPEEDKYYEPAKHKVNERKDKQIVKPDPLVEGGTITTYEPVAKITTSLQKLIIDRAVAFLVGVPIEIDSKPLNSQEKIMDAMVRKTLRDNKSNYRDSEIAELFKKDTECAEVWYSEEAIPEYWQSIKAKGAFKMRLKVMAPSKGDTLYPLFDAAGDLIAFGRGYTTKNGDKDVLNLDLYTDTNIYKFQKAEGDWAQTEAKQHSYGKIPVIYHTQPQTETADVNGKIDRLETLLSNHADTNDYNGSPILAASGAILGFSAKGESGKVVELEAGADLKYVTWNNAPESIKMEIENLLYFTFSETRTPDFSSKDFITGNTTVIGIEMRFLDAHLKAKKSQNGTFGEAIQRRFNLLKSCMAAINVGVKAAIGMDITPVFDVYMPSNRTETIENFTTLVGAGIISKQTALKKMAKMLSMEPEDIEAEMLLLEGEADSISAL